MYWRLLLLFMLFINSVNAQIINIESLKSKKDTNGFSGIENFNFRYTKNTKELITLRNNLGLQYIAEAQSLLFFSDISYSKSGGTQFENNGFIHLRYNYKKSKWLTYELFNQFQTDKQLRIDERILLGAGTRFIVLDTKQRLVMGVAFMGEYDNEQGNYNIHRDLRLSNYISYTLRCEKVSMTTLMYYQPRIDYWEDFRFSGQAQIQLQIWKNLFFTSTASLNYDAFPVKDVDIPRQTAKVMHGLTLKF